ncbi:MAG: S-layer homology domain-containing protein [Dehalobacterium sp.]
MVFSLKHTGEAGKSSDYYVIYDLTSGRALPFSIFSPTTDKIKTCITRGSSFGVKYNEVSFTDTANAWMDEAVKFMDSRDVINGIGNNLFNHKANMTRRDSVLMSMRLFGHDVDPADISDQEYYAKAWALASEKGLLENIGEGEGKYHPGRDVLNCGQADGGIQHVA